MSTDTVSPLRQRMIRGHERAQLCAGTQRPYPRLQAVRGVSQAVPRNGYDRGYPPVSVAPWPRPA